LLAPVPGTRGYTKAIVAAQMLAQIGAFALPALLPGYIARWDLSKTEAGWLVGIFFAAYVVMVPALVSLTDRVPARRVYMLSTGLTALSHFGFALFADGFWSALPLRMLAGIGWAGTYMPGLKAITDPLEGTAQSRAVSWHAAGVGISGAASFAIAGLVGNWAGASASFLLGGATALGAVLIAATVMSSVAGLGDDRAFATAAGFPAGAAQPRRHGLDHRLYGPHLGAVSAARLGSDVSCRGLCQSGRAIMAA
jgi:MFS family permease